MAFLNIVNNSAQLNNTSGWTATSGSLLLTANVGDLYKGDIRLARDRFGFYASAAANWYQDVVLDAGELALIASGTKKIYVLYARCRYGNNAATMWCGLRIEALNAADVSTVLYDDVGNPGDVEDQFYVVDALGGVNIPADTTKIRIRQIYQDDCIIDSIYVGIEEDGQFRVTETAAETLSDSGTSDFNVTLMSAETLSTTETTDLRVGFLSPDVLSNTQTSINIGTLAADSLQSPPSLTDDPTGDLFFNKLIHALHFDGADGATQTEDLVLNRKWYFINSAQLDTSDSKFGGSSLYLPAGTNSYIRTSLVDDLRGRFLDSGLKDTSIEFYCKPLALNKVQYLLSTSGNGTDELTAGYAGWSMHIDASNKVVFVQRDKDVDSQMTVTSSNSVTTGWNHIVLEQSGNNMFLYVNGTLTQLTDTSRLASGNNDGGRWLKVGIFHEGSLLPFEGWIDDLRITKDVTRYAGKPYVAPVAAFPSTGVTGIVPTGLFATTVDVGSVFANVSDMRVSGFESQVAYPVPAVEYNAGLDVQIVISARLVPKSTIHFQVVRY